MHIDPATLQAALAVMTPFAVSGACALGAAFLPKDNGPGVWRFVRQVLDAAGANFGNARNAP